MRWFKAETCLFKNLLLHSLTQVGIKGTWWVKSLVDSSSGSIDWKLGEVRAIWIEEKRDSSKKLARMSESLYWVQVFYPHVDLRFGVWNHYWVAEVCCFAVLGILAISCLLGFSFIMQSSCENNTIFLQEYLKRMQLKLGRGLPSWQTSTLATVSLVRKYIPIYAIF